MGLAVEIGMLQQMRDNDEEGLVYYRDTFARLSKFLAVNGHVGFVEPEVIAGLELPLPHTNGYPYSFLHHLRRAFAHVREGREVKPCAPKENPSRDPLIDRELTVKMSSHLVCHSDAEGFYVPLDFADVLYPERDDDLPGGMIGSSHRLLAELAIVAPALDIALGPDGASEETLDAIDAAPESPDTLWRERLVWSNLHVTARASIRYGTTIVFC